MASPTLSQLSRLFLKLGFVAFGGPAAHIAMMEEEVVTIRGWFSRKHFMDLLGATNLIPGPNSTEMALHVGYTVRGFSGLLVAGICFILPAALMTGTLAWFYLQYGRLPQLNPFLTGIKACVVAIILAAVVRLGRSAVTSVPLALIAITVLAAGLAGVSEVILILAGGIVGMLWLSWMKHRVRTLLCSLLPLGLLLPRGLALFSSGAAPIAAPAAPGLTEIGLFFLKIGSILFGSGYVLFAFLEGGMVRDNGWLTSQQLLDTIAAGQLTPGPVLTTATFTGFLLKGWSGALTATAAIFLPSFVFVLLLNPLIPRLRESPWTASFLDAVNASALGLMAAVVIQLGRATLVDWQGWLIALAAAVLATRFKVSTPLLIAGSAVVGWATL